MKPNFESPAHTARDLVERNITVYDVPNEENWKRWLSQSDIPEHRKIGENLFITQSWDQFDKMTQNELLNEGTHAQLVSLLLPFELKWGTEYDHDQGRYKRNSGRGYYRGETLVLNGTIPYSGYLTNKKWHLNEVDNNAALQKALLTNK